MIRCRFRGFYGTYKARSHRGWYMGSHQRVQTLLEPLFKSQLNVWVLYTAGRWRMNHPLPPAPRHARAGVYLNFFSLFVGKGFCMTINQKEYTHGL